MDSYLYPTNDGWLEPMLNDWKYSGLPRMMFPFFGFRVTTLPQDTVRPFWMYVYYTKRSTEDEALRGVVQFRVRVTRYSFDPIIDSGAHHRDYELQGGDKETVYFLIDRVDEVTNSTGEALKLADFVHRDGSELSSTIHNSIAPVKRIVPMVTVQTTSHNPQD